jgi:hypothetical protein
MFKGRKLVIATKHGKEEVIAPLMRKTLGVRCLVPSDFNSDQFGTFTGDIERRDDPLTVAREKCLLAMELSGCDLAISSEGSFGPHPSLLFGYVDEELVLLVDKKNKIEISYTEMSTKTNFGGMIIENDQELMAFADQAGFPTHALIIRDSRDSLNFLAKGITDQNDLLVQFRFSKERFSSAFVETDMRAMYNPMRMAVIKLATEKLIAKVKSHCPVCETPGFGVTEAIFGLPCSECGSPTRSTLLHVYTCAQCAFTKQRFYPFGLKTEQPMYCDLCNP